MGIYYGSKVAEAVEKGSLGMQYLPASYLADDVLKDARPPSGGALPAKAPPSASAQPYEARTFYLSWLLMATRAQPTHL